MSRRPEPAQAPGPAPSEGSADTVHPGGPAHSGDSARHRLSSVAALDIDPLIEDRGTRIVVCCGSGGVGKTTTAAALGLRAAERGRKVVVLTIDPARRLAQSMGIDSLDNVPRRVKGIDDSAGGELHAMMLDMKRTFDEIVEAHADPERASAILGNPFYQSLSAGFAGTQEYMAMEKLGQLRARDEWDLIVVDTPPSRSALDFLDAPKRLGSFLDGKLIRVLLAPAKVGGRAGMKFLNVGMSMMTGVLGKVLGGQLLGDVQTFVAAMDSMFGGFRTRADATFKLLQAPGTAFLVVAAPERDALREAAYFVERLAAEDMPLAGLVLNRVHGSGADRLSAERALAAAENLEDSRIVDQEDGKAGLRNSPDTYESSADPAADTPTPEAPGTPDTSKTSTPAPPGTPAQDDVPDGGSPATVDDTGAGRADEADAERSVGRLTAGLLRLHAERMRLLSREQRTRDRFTALHPEVAVTEVAALPGDVHDLAGLRDIGDRLAADRPELPGASA
ncbi:MULTISPECIES: ArsA family ATPase [unclassified Streptomyces]|uniref:ArsA family ATPase n=1 Tax=unclassified Streptomyces TaxID=2593676 RepID=UPI00073C6844|nr:ArsA family ATPase [Streptomyces sp. AVP053U2]ODA73232.1 membrane ATPase/protein kinase [Streptomyces sp. AVP053U2]